MSLTRDQKSQIQEWVAAGYGNKEIMRMAAESNPPFYIKSANITKTYRNPVRQKVRQIQSEREDNALKSGLALKENRIRRLEEYERMVSERIGRAKDGREMSSLINTARGCLDDIAKELGERRDKVDVNANLQVRDIVAIMSRVYEE